MRILHTSDWHLGQNFYSKSRAAEHQAFLDWLLETANVVGTPGEGFGPCGKGYFRLTAFGDAARTKEAAARIKAALAAL